MYGLSNKAKQYLLPAAKAAVILCCAGYFTWSIYSGRLDGMGTAGTISELPTFFFLLLPLLSIASWMIESHKWRFLVGGFRELRFRESVTHNLIAQAASVVTPLRAGEFATKTLFFPKHQRKQVLRAVLAGNSSQMAVTLIMGMSGVALFYGRPLMALGATVVLVWLGIKSCSVLKGKIGFQPRFLARVTWFSFLRYVAFSSCWLLVLMHLSNAGALKIFGCVTTMYLITSIIPIIQMFDLLLKWSVASFFVGDLHLPLESMTAVIALLWLNNTVLPSVVGCALLALQSRAKPATA